MLTLSLPTGSLEEATMHARIGDQIRVRGHHLGELDRCGEITATRGPDGSPPFMVRWDDSDHEVLFFPGTDATVDSLATHVRSDG
jgi:Domain of unknown function (DUF1918)